MHDDPRRGQAQHDVAALDGAAALELLARHAAQLSEAADVFFEVILAALAAGETPAAAADTALAGVERIVAAAGAELTAAVAIAQAATAHALRTPPQ